MILLDGCVVLFVSNTLSGKFLLDWFRYFCLLRWIWERENIVGAVPLYKVCIGTIWAMYGQHRRSRANMMIDHAK